MELRMLQPATDERLYRTAWAWHLAYPRLVQRWDGLKHFRHWFALMKRRVSVGVFTDKLVAVITFRPAGDDVYEVHVDCERRADKDVLFTALMSMRRMVFEQWHAREVFVGVIDKNCGIIRMAETCGFKRDGIDERVGQLRWIRMRMTADEFHEDKYRHIEQHGNLRTAAGR